MNQPIPYTKPSITPLEVAYASDAAANGWGARCYAYIERFERMLCEHLGVAHALATSSCTGALQLGLAGIGVGRGDEVILADCNWVASVAPVVHLGAEPRFVDILPSSWCIDPTAVQHAISPRTRAIIAVHLYGNLCDLDALAELAEHNGLALIEDAAEAIGSQYRGRPAGSVGRFGVFSFHGTKTVTTGEGGAFVTNDAALFEEVLTLSNHGRVRGAQRQFWAERVGYKFKMANVQAAIGCAQLERVDELIARKRDIMEGYRERLAGIARLELNAEPAGTRIGAWMPTVVFDASLRVSRDLLQAAFAADNIDARVFFHPLSSMPPFVAQPSNRNAWDIPTRAINLPSFHDMTAHEQNRVANVIKRCIDAAS